MHINRSAIELKLLFNKCYEAVKSTQILKLESKTKADGGSLDDSVNYSSLNFTLNNSFMGASENPNHLFAGSNKNTAYEMTKRSSMYR